MTNLHTVIGAEKHIKSRAHGIISELYKLLDKPQLFSGQVRTYQKKFEDGDELLPEIQRIVMPFNDIMRRVCDEMSDIMDVTAQKDIGNQSAKASVMIGGNELLKDVPVTTLLFLEKTVTDFRTFISKAPVLDGSEKWELDADDGLHKSAISRTHRTKKTQKPIVLYDATDKHPAQTQLITEDEIVGFWDTRKMSSALPPSRKIALLDRIDVLLQAIKDARERANDSVVSPREAIGSRIFSYLLEK